MSLSSRLAWGALGRARVETARSPLLVLDDALRKVGAVEDFRRTYDLGASSFIRKPVSFDALVDAIQALGRYWIEIVELPEEGSR